MGAERPDVFVDPVWTDEKDIPHLGGLAEDWHDAETSRVSVALGRRESAIIQTRYHIAVRPMGFRLPAAGRHAQASEMRPTWPRAALSYRCCRRR